MKFKNCNLYKMPLLDLLPIVRNVIISLPFLRNCTGSLLEKELFFKNLLSVKKSLSNEAPLFLSDFVEIYVPGTRIILSNYFGCSMQAFVRTVMYTESYGMVVRFVLNFQNDQTPNIILVVLLKIIELF